MSPFELDPTTTGQVLYFGKLPCRGDFVRSAQHASLLNELDQWQARTLERMSADPRWKLVYDAAPEFLFLTLGTGKREVVAGHWQASQDSSGRRFPFITTAVFEWPHLRDVAVLSPMMLCGVWSALARAGQAARVASAHVEAQASLQAVLPEAVSAERARTELLTFLDTCTVSGMEQMLSSSGTRLSLRQAVLAVGLLLQPVLTQGVGRLNKVLRVPLAADPSRQAQVASWWLLLVLGFFQRHEVELAMFLDLHRGPPHLLLGFQGRSAATLESVIDPHAPGRECVNLTPSDWVDAEVVNDVGLRKLSTYLSDPELSLWQAIRTCQEVFLGA
jgi:type VI secretion system protein ImpM